MAGALGAIPIDQLMPVLQAALQATPEQGDASMERRPDEAGALGVIDGNRQTSLGDASMERMNDAEDDHKRAIYLEHAGLATPEQTKDVHAQAAQEASKERDNLSPLGAIPDINQPAVAQYGGPGKAVPAGQPIPQKQLPKDQVKFMQQKYEQDLATGNPNAAQDRLALEDYKDTQRGVLGKIGQFFTPYDMRGRNQALEEIKLGSETGLQGAQTQEAKGSEGATAASMVGQPIPDKPGEVYSLQSAREELEQAKIKPPQATPGSEDAAALEKTKEINPATGKPFTLAEARMAMQKPTPHTAEGDRYSFGELSNKVKTNTASPEERQQFADLGAAHPQWQPVGNKANRLNAEIADTIRNGGNKVDPANYRVTPDMSQEDAAQLLHEAQTNTAPGTKVSVYNQTGGATAAANRAARQAGKYFSYKDDSGVHLVTGDKLPPDVDAVPIKDLQAFVAEGHANNVVQQGLNRINEDLEKHPEVFDNPTARNILATSTQEIDRASAGLLIAGTGGSIPIPSGMGNMIDTALQNNVLDNKTAEALKRYIADYKAMKDKAIVMQMDMQNGKIGRGSTLQFRSITDQIPNGATGDSKTARRQLDNLQLTQDELREKYPDSYSDYRKETVYKRKDQSGAGSVPAGATHIWHNPANGKDYYVDSNRVNLGEKK
jgi:hypothetical protein